MTRLEEIRIEKKELLQYKELLQQLETLNRINSESNSIPKSEIEDKTSFDKPKIKKLGVRQNEHIS